MNENETIADILREMREPRTTGITEHNEWLMANLRHFADRIEAAAELERIELREDEAKMLLREYAAAPDESLTPSALELKRELLRLAPRPGNAAALREALERIAWESRNAINSKTTGVERANVLAAYLMDFRDTADAALATPARNCDRFHTLDEAREAFQEMRGHRISADVELWDSMDEAGAFARWLFAPAEGCAK